MLRHTCCAALLAYTVVLTDAQASRIPPGSKIFIQRMDGFGADLAVALIGVNAPLVIVNDRNAAEFEIAGRLERHGTTFSSEIVHEATITITNIKSTVLVDAYTVTGSAIERVARGAAARMIEGSIAPNIEARAVESTKPVSSRASSTPMRLYVQGDPNRLADFIRVLRGELRVAGIDVEVVQRGEPYDYNVVFVQTEAEAAAIALDREGVLVASAVDSAIRAKGATEGSARALAKRITAIAP